MVLSGFFIYKMVAYSITHAFEAQNNGIFVLQTTERVLNQKLLAPG